MGKSVTGGDTTNGVQTYDPSKSSGKQLAGEAFRLSYGQGGNGVHGPVYSDKFCFQSACVDSMPIGVANYSQGMGDVKSGIIGLAFKGGNSVRPTQQEEFIALMQPALQQPVFVTKFNPDSGAKITFGSVDTNSYVAPLQKIKVDNGAKAKYSYSWSVENVEYYMGNTKLGA